MSSVSRSRATVERASAPERRGGNGGVWFAGALLGILAAAALAHRHDTIDESAVAQAPAPAPSPSWMRVGELSDGTRAQFVSVRREVVQDRSTYDAVVNQLCRDRPICVVAFFLSGEQMPLGGDSAKFTAQGGFAAYRPLAVWWSNRNTGVAGFTKWDCIRAGRAGAPPDALCGKKP